MVKRNLKSRLGMAPIWAVFVGVLALFLLFGHRVDAAEQARPDSDAEDSGGHNPNPALFSPQSHPYGRDMDTWAENWWRWELGIPAAENPLLSSTADCSVNQSGPVFFIPPVTVGSTNRVRNCTIEHGKAIAVLLSSVLNDYPCPDPTFQPAPGQSLFDFLLAGAVAGNGDIAEIDVTLDGQPLKDMLDYHFASERLMFFKGDLSLQSSVDSCITGNFQPAAVDAYLILFKPLRPGHHTIVRTIITTRGTVTGPTTTEIDVLPEH